MPTLDWIGKKAVIEQHKEVPFHLLKCNESLSVGYPGSGNLLVQGDNLLALKALLPYYAGQVKCIYIDPPYNTGNESWAYNDKVNSPEIIKWLGEVVGKEGTDLSRHDKWLCMMFPRIKVLRDFLSDDGVIFISIDNNEVHNLRLLLDEIFGPRNFLTCIANINNPKGRSDDKYVATAHEYLLCYKKNSNPILYGWKPEDKVIKRYNKIDRNGKRYREIDLRKTGDNDRKEDRPNLFYFFYYNQKSKDFYASRENQNREGYVKIIPLREDGLEGNWRWELDTSNNNLNRLLPKLMPIRKVWTVFEMDYLDPNERIKPTSAWTKKDFNSERGTEQFLRLGFKKDDFTKPKPVGLLEHILEFSTSKNDIILDSFAGSGTTGHAVMNLNKKDGGNRNFILIEMDPAIARNITFERLNKVIKGYAWKDKSGNENIEEGINSGFRYCELGKTLFDTTRQIQEEVGFSDLARHVFFSETGEPLSAKSKRSSLLGVINGTAIYLLYNGILGDKSVQGGNVLTREVLAKLPAYNGPKIIYGNGCRIGSERLKRENIIFKQIPYEVRVG